MKRQCLICNEEFETNTRSKICNKDHYLRCPDCGTSILWNRTDQFHGCKPCNQKRAVVARKKTMLERYGGETTLQCKSLSEKVARTVQRKYGTDNVMKNKQVQKKAAQTNCEKYGGPNPMMNKDIAKRSAQSRQTSMDEIIAKTKQTWLDKYGVDNISKSPEIIDKIAETFMQRYGVKRAASVPEFQDKMKATMLERYGVPYYVLSDEYRESAYFRISKINTEFSELLSQHNVQHQLEYRIGLKAYDIFAPSHNLLIEIDPTYTHNAIGNHWSGGLDKYYHRDKTQLAIDNGYRCIHVFDWDSWDKIIGRYFPDKFMNASEFGVYRLNIDATNEFLDKNDLRGRCRGQVLCLGLVKDNEIYQVMTFGKSRFDKSYSMQLLRMCTKLGYEIEGGYDLLSHEASQTFGISSMIAYCDRAKSDGELHGSIGMKLIRTTPPTKIWSRGSEYVYHSLARRKNTQYSTDSLLDAGYLPVYDCGQRVYAFK